MNNQHDLARGWFRKGDSDLTTARLITNGAGPYDTACFHAQQAAEKYLKGFLTFAGVPFPFTHNLEDLAMLCTNLQPSLNVSTIDLTLLTPYAVQARYDAEFWPSQATAFHAISMAEQVRSAVVAVIPI